MTEPSGGAPQQSVQVKVDPYHLSDYAANFVPRDGGRAPEQKTAEPTNYHQNRMYVSNIPFSFQDQDLIALFSRFGQVLAAMIVCNERGSKGFGFVTMDSVESCERARANLHGTLILGRVIEVRKALPNRDTRRPQKRTAAMLKRLSSQQTRQMQQQNFLQSFLAKNPALLHGLLMPLINQNLISSVPVAPPLLSTFPVPPLNQAQATFPFSVPPLQPSIPPLLPMNTLGMGILGGQNDALQLSLNNTLMNAPARFMPLQDQLANVFGLDSTLRSPAIYYKNGAQNSNHTEEPFIGQSRRSSRH